VKFFIDNNLSVALAQAMHMLSAPFGHETWHLTQRFEENTDDLVWIDVLSKEGGWSVITQDKLNKRLEREALRDASLIVFFLDRGWAHHEYWDKAWNLIRWCPRIVQHSEEVRSGEAYKVPFNFSGKGQFSQVRL
jgi:hypothetical protein